MLMFRWTKIALVGYGKMGYKANFMNVLIPEIEPEVSVGVYRTDFYVYFITNLNNKSCFCYIVWWYYLFNIFPIIP